MLSWALMFFVVALIAAAFGFGGIAASAAGIARVLFFIFLVLFVVSLLTGLVHPPRMTALPPAPAALVSLASPSAGAIG